MKSKSQRGTALPQVLEKRRAKDPVPDVVELQDQDPAAGGQLETLRLRLRTR